MKHYKVDLQRSKIVRILILQITDTFMISVFGWPDRNTGFDQSEHALYTCYFITFFTKHNCYVSTSFNNFDGI